MEMAWIIPYLMLATPRKDDRADPFLRLRSDKLLQSSNGPTTSISYLTPCNAMDESFVKLEFAQAVSTDVARLGRLRKFLFSGHVMFL